MQLLWHSSIYRCQATGPQVGCYLLEPKTLPCSELREICHRHVSDNKDRTFAKKKLSAQNSNRFQCSCVPAQTPDIHAEPCMCDFCRTFALSDVAFSRATNSGRHTFSPLASIMRSSHRSQDKSDRNTTQISCSDDAHPVSAAVSTSMGLQLALRLR